MISFGKYHGAINTPINSPAATQLAISLIEGWRGELCHVALTDEQGRFERYKIVDPSFHNSPRAGDVAAESADFRFSAV